MKQKNFEETYAVGFEPTRVMESRKVLSGTDRHRQNALPEKEQSKLAETPSEDHNMWIIVGVVLAVMLIALLPQFGWFQEWTAITGWIPFLRNLTGIYDVGQFFRNVFGW